MCIGVSSILPRPAVVVRCSGRAFATCCSSIVGKRSAVRRSVIRFWCSRAWIVCTWTIAFRAWSTNGLDFVLQPESGQRADAILITGGTYTFHMPLPANCAATRDLLAGNGIVERVVKTIPSRICSKAAPSGFARLSRGCKCSWLRNMP